MRKRESYAHALRAFGIIAAIVCVAIVAVHAVHEHQDIGQMFWAVFYGGLLLFFLYRIALLVVLSACYQFFGKLISAKVLLRQRLGKRSHTADPTQQQYYYNDESPEQVPLQEDITLGTFPITDRFMPPVPNDNEEEEHEQILQDDNTSLGETVASSTCGEDRQKVVNESLLDPWGDKGIYTGVVLCSTGMPHGLGRMVYEEDGRIYEGDWCHGRWHGYGQASFSNGDSYKGAYRSDRRHGQGVYRWRDGRVYNGEFREDKRHGKGTFSWPDGAIYEGDFVNGQREGHGTYTFSDGGQYSGGWRDGRYDGFGTCTWEDGRCYRGEWRNGMAHGKGVELYPDGRVRHDGQWIDDEPVR